jgi:FkbM family methyltransferase
MGGLERGWHGHVGNLRCLGKVAIAADFAARCLGVCGRVFGVQQGAPTDVARLGEYGMSLRRELVYALGQTASVGDTVRLLALTAVFHLRNRKIIPDAPPKPMSVNVMFGAVPRTVELRSGRAGDLFILYEVLAFGAYRIAPELVAPAEIHTIVDCGANIGITALYFAHIYPKARILSIEANPHNFALLTQNTKAVSRIEPIHACIVPTPRPSVRFSIEGPAWGGHIVEQGGIEVPAVTLDEIIASHGLSRVDLLKVDIEGAEEAVFSSGAYLGRVQHVIAELHGGYSYATFQDAMLRASRTRCVLQLRRIDKRCYDRLSG